MSQIQKFYAGQNVFITGATGFLGRVLIEKLLHSCPDIGTLYVLVRPKKGKSVKERIDALFADLVFDNLRNDYPDFSKKVIGVPGDIAEERLGLSAADHARIVNEVSVIFHLAATVRFNEPLNKAVAFNVKSVKSIVDIAKECKNLKVGIYVSTAYSHCVRKSIDEELYPPPLSYEGVNQVVRDIFEVKLPEDEVQNLTEKVVGEWPNTYSFTKAIAEGVVAEFAKDMPFAIFRPSIVTSAYAEPVPGWLPGPFGVAGLVAASGIGIVHAGLMATEAVTDLVPVDYVCNALISSAWKTAITDKRHHEKIPVYNYVSGPEKPITWQVFLDSTEKFGHMYPTNKAVYYPSGFITTSKRLFSILEFFLHLIPALIIDSIAGIFGKQPGLYKILRQIGVAWRALFYFATQQWEFKNQRVQNLWKELEIADKKTFPFSMQNFDWDEYFMRMVRGIRRYLVRETDDNLAQARRRHFCLYVIHTIVRLTVVIFVLLMIQKLFYTFSPTIDTENVAA